MKLSVVIITKNEERNIERCLKSIVDVADEILVVDSFSTDKTIELCGKYGVKLVKHKFEGYGSQKLFATEQAHFDYILSLDADEELSKELKESILKTKVNPAYDCYSFNRRNFFGKKPIRFCGWYPDKKIRLFNRLKINWNDKQVHESIEVLDRQMVSHLSGDLNHYTSSSAYELIEKGKQYAEINAGILIKSGKSVSFVTPYLKGCFHFLKCYLLKFGFLDGCAGFIICLGSANSTFHKYSLVRKGSLSNRI